MTSDLPRRQTRYTDAEAAAALAVLEENKGNVAATSRATGIPEQTIREWRNGSVRILPPELVAEERARRAASWEMAQDLAVDRVIAKVGEASPYQAAIIAGIATEKALLLRGEATSITETRDDGRLAAFAAAYSKRRPVNVTPTATDAATDTQPAPAPLPPAETPPESDAHSQEG